MFCRSAQELTLLACVDHPNTVRVIDVLLPATSTKADACIVMEYAGVPLDLFYRSTEALGYVLGFGLRGLTFWDRLFAGMALLSVQ